MLSKKIALVLVATTAMAGTLLAWRGFTGPHEWKLFTMKSPVNAQCIVGLSVTVLLLLNSTNVKPFRTRTRHVGFWLAAVLVLTIGSLWQETRFPLVFDDYTLVKYGQGLTSAMIKFYFTHAGGDGFFRPIGYLSFGLDASFAARDPVRWHLTGLILHLANIVFVWLLARRIAADNASGLWAAATFALHGSVPLTPTYLAARFDVLAAFFVLSGLLLFVTYINTNRLFALIASLACMLAGLLSKETAYAFPFLALVLAGDRVMANWRALATFFILTGAAFAYRYNLLGGIGGYRNPVTGLPDISHTSYLSYVKGFGLRIWSNLFFPVNWSHPLEPWLSIMLVICLAALITIGSKAHVPRAGVLGALAFIGAALLPLAHLLLLNSDLLGAGRFYLAVVGFSALIGISIRSTTMPRQILVGAALITFQFTASQHNALIWGQTAALVRQTCRQAAAFVGRQTTTPLVSGLPRDIDGIPFLANGFEACVDFYRPADEHAIRPAADFVWDPTMRRLVQN